MNYAAIKPYDIANGPGVRVSLFVSGCTHHCPGCFNPEAWDFRYGEEFTNEVLQNVIDMLEPEHISGLTILGGEPMEPENIFYVYTFVDLVRRTMPWKTIWLYTGSTFEELRERKGMLGLATEEIFRLINVLVDGPFIETQKNISLQFRGSENQRIIDMPQTMKCGEIVLWEGDHNA